MLVRMWIQLPSTKHFLSWMATDRYSDCQSELPLVVSVQWQLVSVRRTQGGFRRLSVAFQATGFQPVVVDFDLLTGLRFVANEALHLLGQLWRHFDVVYRLGVFSHLAQQFLLTLLGRGCMIG